jgi:DNA-binding response OmpR family regulator
MNATTDRTPRALLLENDPGTLDRLAGALRARGLEVLAERDGEAGLARLIDTLLDLDVLVVGAALPGRDATALLRLVRGAGGERELPIVVAGSGLGAGVKVQLLLLGADAVVDLADGAEAAAREAATAARSGRAAGAPLRAAAPTFLPVPLPAPARWHTRAAMPASLPA